MKVSSARTASGLPVHTHAIEEIDSVFSFTDLGFTQDWNADSLALADGAAVASWTDSIAGIAATQGTGANRPTYRSMGFFGPTVQFDGSNDLLTFGSSIAVEDNFTIMLVMSTTGDSVVLSSSANGNSRVRINYGSTPGIVNMYDGVSDTFGSAFPWSPSACLNVITCRCVSGVLTTFCNGLALGGGTQGDAMDFGQMGQLFGGSFPVSGHVKRILFHATSGLTDANLIKAWTRLHASVRGVHAP